MKAKTNIVMVRLTDEDKEMLKAASDLLDRSQSSLARMFIMAGLRNMLEPAGVGNGENGGE